ncbi:MAG: hypothetical protein RLZZ524_2473 [Pseudomonadota bacterium]|jgi:hypothetical protein
MRIALRDGTTYHWLAGDPAASVRAHSWADGFSLTPESAQQINQFVRADYAEVLDRGNLLNNLSFQTVRQFASPAEAELFCLDYHGTFPSSGTLVLEAIAPSGAVIRRHINSAVVTPPQRSVIGASAMLSYNVMGGEIITPSLHINGPLTSNGSSSVTFPALIPAGEQNDRAMWSNDGTGVLSAQYWCLWTGFLWQIVKGDPSAVWQSASDVPTPDMATGWAPVSPATGTPVVALG